MGHLTDDMTSLSRNIDSSRRMRETLIQDLKRDVAEAKADAVEMIAGFRSACDHMGRTARAERLESVTDMKATVNETRAGFRETHFKQTAEGRNQLREFVSEVKEAVGQLRSDATTMLAGFRTAHDDMAGKTKTNRLAFVSDLKLDIAEAQAGFRNTRAEMATQTKAGLKTFVSGIEKHVSGLRTTVVGLRKEIVADIEGAHRAWGGAFSVEPGIVEQVTPRPPETTYRTEQEEQRSDRTQEVRQEEEPRETGAEPQMSEHGTSGEVVSDDLTSIQGIGMGIQHRLNEAGIYTFAQLAGSTSEDLRQLLGKLARFADLERWVEQARAMVGLP